MGEGTWMTHSHQMRDVAHFLRNGATRFKKLSTGARQRHTSSSVADLVKFRPAWLMRQHCGLTSIRCHFEWRHPPSPFPFSQTHTHFCPSSPFRWPTALALRCRCARFGPALFLWMKGTRRWSDGASVGRGEEDEVKGEGWHIPQPDHVTTSARGKMAMQPCSAYSGWMHFLFFFFEGDGSQQKKKKKEGEHHLNLISTVIVWTVSRREMVYSALF